MILQAPSKSHQDGDLHFQDQECRTKPAHLPLASWVGEQVQNMLSILRLILKMVRLEATKTENLHDIGKSPFSIGNTSSNGGLFIVMLVFGGGTVLLEGGM